MFSYCENQLGIVDGESFISLSECIREKLGQYESPVYVYDKMALSKKLTEFKKAFSIPISIHYALKSNSHPEILGLFNEAGIGLDVVSGGELSLGLKHNFKPKQIVFSGVGKTKQEIKKAIDSDILQINIESPQELIRVGQMAKATSKKVDVAFRVNPDVNPDTHPYITTGFRENKFGMDESFFPELKEILKTYESSLNLVGLTLHIGSQIKEMLPFKEAIEKTLVQYRQLQAEGYDLKTFDIGGGLGLSYEKEDAAEDARLLTEYGALISDIFKNFDGQVLCEPGRILTARQGVLVSQVQYIKKTESKVFAILDTGMHHLMRPCLYQAYHRVLPLVADTAKPKINYDIVGPICESSDVIGRDRYMQELKQDDLVAIMDAGAYGAVMANSYNEHGPVTEIVV